MSEWVRPNVAAAAGYIPGEQPTDTHTIKLNTNENPYPPSPKVMEAIRGVTAEQLRRYPSPNARPFREAAARVHGVTPEMILTFNGGDELLAATVRACAGEKDAVAFLDPSYSLYPVLTEMQGARPIVLKYEEKRETQNAKHEAGGELAAIENRKSKIENSEWVLPAGIEQTDAALLMIVNPNAPTGHFNPIAELERIATGFRGVLLIDEAYVDFATESALPLVSKHKNVLLLRTLSKGYGLAGLRFGYAIGQPELLKEIEKVRDSYPCDAVSIAAATAAIEDQPYARETWARVIAERERLQTGLRGLGFDVPASQANFVLAQVPASGKGNAQGIYEELKRRGILVRWWDLPRIADRLRITVGTAEQNERLLTELKTMVK